jgi:hypothetical protein
MNLNYLKRTIRPLYANTQATPQNMLLDPYWDFSCDIYPGMALYRRAGQLVAPYGTTAYTGGNPPQTITPNAGARVFGLSDFFEAPKLGIRQISDSGVNACAVWVLGPDSLFQVMSPAFDPAAGWAAANTAIATGIPQYVDAYAVDSGGTYRGQLKPSSAVTVITAARLISVDSPSQITIGGLTGTV